eukprot:m.214088 g.214088  ORF g.214088 m.214088 type:complete len:477 (+) comp33169_c0_seq9:397-1827(+)
MTMTPECHGNLKRKLNIFTHALRNDAVDDFFNSSDKLHQECQASKSGLIKQRRYALKSYKSCFKGNSFVSHLIEVGYASSRVEGCAIGCSLLMHGVIHHVCDEHHFKDEALFYRFRKDDDTYQGDLKPFRQAAVQAVRLHGILRAKHPKMIASRDFELFSYQKCLVASHLIDWLVEHGKCKTRINATDLCRRMQSFNLIDHVTSAHVFQDKYLYFRFVFDTLQADTGFLEFTKMEQGLAYLGHLDRGSNTKDRQTFSPVMSASSSTSDSESNSGNSLTAPRGLTTVANLQLSEREDVVSDSESNSSLSPKLRRSSPGSLSGSLLSGSFSKARKLDKIWYHGPMSRDDVAAMFETQNFANGSWLVRDYRSNPKNFVLSVSFEKEMYHIVISCKNNMYRIDTGPEFDSVQALTMFYQSARAQKEVPTPLVEYIAYRPTLPTPLTPPPTFTPSALSLTSPTITTTTSPTTTTTSPPPLV